MAKNMLYYPTIEFQEKDYRWLWCSALLWDKVYRIVPDGYQLNEPDIIKELCSSGDIGSPLSPQRYSKDASDKFIENLKNRKWDAAALEYHHDDIREYENYSRLHKDKTDVVLQNLILHNQSYEDSCDWLHVPQELSNQYMIYLATEIAEKNSLSLNTCDPDIWTASSFFINDGLLQNGYYSGKDYAEEFESKSALSLVNITNIFPSDPLALSPKQILDFREKRKDQRWLFHQALDTFAEKLSKARDQRILKQIWKDEMKEIDFAVTEFKRSMDILNIKKTTGYIAKSIPLAASAIGILSPQGGVIQAANVIGIALNVVAGLLKTDISTVSERYSYLGQVHELVAGSFQREMYDLKRKVKEFIDD